MKKREIGSFYELEELYEEWFDGDQSKENFITWLNRTGVTGASFFESGRAAQVAIVSEIEKRTANRTALLPSYLCDTVIKPFTNRGWRVFFYQLNDDMTPDADKLKRLVSDKHPGVVLTVLYYGKDSIYEIRPYLDLLRKNAGVLTIEDLTQTIFMFEKKNDDSENNYRMASVRKWLPISSGGVAVLRARPVYDVNRSDYVFKQHKAQELKKEYLSGYNANKEKYLWLHRQAEEILEGRYGCFPMDLDSYGLLSVCDLRTIKKRRNRNTQILNNKLRKMNRIRPILDFEDGEIPLYFPIISENRDKLQGFMKKKNIFLPVLWPVPYELYGDYNRPVRNIYENMLALPCDHRYGEDDMMRIVSMLEKYEGAK